MRISNTAFKVAVPLIAAAFLASCSPKFKNGEYMVYKSEEGRARMMKAYGEALSMWKVPYVETDLDTPWGKTHVITCGKNNGKPLVLLHGGSSNSSFWLMSIKDLSADHRVYAVDTIGDCGKSRAVKLPENPKDYSDWLSDVFAALKLKKASIIGVSYGGFIAQWFLNYHPENIDRAVLYSFSPMDSGVKLSTMARMIYYVIFNSHENLHKSIAWYNNGPLKNRETEEKFVELFDLVYKNCNPHMTVPVFLSETEMKNIKPPLMIILGEKDVIYDPVKSREYCRRTNPAIRFETMPGAGHFLGVEPEGGAVLNRMITGFLK
ncbi:MAG: alpha/beta hydrolase [Spirochaetes bacterium]|jgi:pimeloyl-ACP methyl ester carboxylesterase|nr:alpha/beta hydrolase [Spirochaetota bacterium]